MTIHGQVASGLTRFLVLSAVNLSLHIANKFLGHISGRRRYAVFISNLLDSDEMGGDVQGKVKGPPL